MGGAASSTHHCTGPGLTAQRRPRGGDVANQHRLAWLRVCVKLLRTVAIIHDHSTHGVSNQAQGRDLSCSPHFFHQRRLSTELFLLLRSLHSTLPQRWERDRQVTREPDSYGAPAANISAFLGTNTRTMTATQVLLCLLLLTGQRPGKHNQTEDQNGKHTSQ